MSLYYTFKDNNQQWQQHAFSKIPKADQTNWFLLIITSPTHPKYLDYVIGRLEGGRISGLESSLGEKRESSLPPQNQEGRGRAGKASNKA